MEFALIAPLVMAMLLGVADFSRIAYDRTDMFAAVRSGAQYFMAGGQDLERGRQIILSAWTNPPEDATVAVERICQCQSQESACDQPCPDGTAPAVFVRIQVSAVLNGMLTNYSSLASDTVRVR